jgi:hypothetical protein
MVQDSHSKPICGLGSRYNHIDGLGSRSIHIHGSGFKLKLFMVKDHALT